VLDGFGLVVIRETQKVLFMKRKASAMTLLSAFLLVVVLLSAFGFKIVDVAYANWIGAFFGLPIITIQSDGSVVPQTEFVKQAGDVYLLEYDLAAEYVININCSNIVFDGQGRCINGSMNFLYAGVWRNFNCAGITVEDVTNVTIKNVTVCNFVKPCISIYGCSRINVLGVQTDYVSLEESDHSVISNSVIDLCLLGSAKDNEIFRNKLSLLIRNSPGNSLYENNIFPSNDYDLTDGASRNSWSNSSVGNYWNSYSPSDANGDGVGDTPYWIGTNNWDNYPLTEPVIIPEIVRVVAPPPDPNSPRISLFSPEDIMYNASSVPLNFSVNKQPSNMSYSLDGQKNVSISGNVTLSELTNGAHNLTVYVTDEAGNTGVSDTVYFTVDTPEPFPVVQVAAAVSIAAFTPLVVGLLIYFKKRNR
jgi:hypothetical protein